MHVNNLTVSLSLLKTQLNTNTNLTTSSFHTEILHSLIRQSQICTNKSYKTMTSTYPLNSIINNCTKVHISVKYATTVALRKIKYTTTMQTL